MRGFVWWQDVSGVVSGEVPGLVAMYKGLHDAPELSHHEADAALELLQ